MPERGNISIIIVRTVPRQSYGAAFSHVNLSLTVKGI
jgi:hypothetical protein